MVRYVFVTLDFARIGYVYAAPFAAMVAMNCASVIPSTIFFSNVNYGRHNGCGGPKSWLPSPSKKIIYHQPVLALLRWGYILNQQCAPVLLGVSFAHLPDPHEPDLLHLV